MAPKDLQSFITLLEQADELVRIEAQVDPCLEVATIIDRVSKGAGRGRALLFEHVAGSSLPLAANLFGSVHRVAWALGTTDLTGLAERLQADLAATGVREATTALQTLVRVAETSTHSAAPLWQAVDLTGLGLTGLPVLQHWPGDGGRYITLGQVFTRAPEGDTVNCGMYRIQVIDQARATVQWRPGSGAAAHHTAWQALGQPMPVAIALGGPPALTWTAGLPLPAGVSETSFAGYLTGEAPPLAACWDAALQVPATAEVVIEGVVHPDEWEREGPFGNHTGRYAPSEQAALLRVSRISCREQAAYPATLVGPPPMEDLFMAKAAERLLLPLLRHDHPWVKEVSMPLSGVYHRAALVAIDPSEIGSVNDLAGALWGSTLLRNARLLVLLDAGEPLDDPDRVFWRLINSPDWTRRVLVDPQRLVLDARGPGDAVAVRPDPTMLKRVLDRWSEFGIDN